MNQDSLMNKMLTSMIPAMMSQVKDSTARSHSKEMMSSTKANYFGNFQKDMMMVLMQKYMSEIQKSIKAKIEEIKNATSANKKEAVPKTGRLFF